MRSTSGSGRAEAANRARAAEAREATASGLAAKRLAPAKAATAELTQLRTVNEDLHERFEGEGHLQGVEAIAKLAQIPRLRMEAVRRAHGARGASHRWPNWMRALIMEYLVNNTPPSAIPSNIVSAAAYLLPFLVDIQVPDVRFCQNMRGELRIYTETLAAYQLAGKINWRQLFTDGTSRRQTHLLTVIIGIDGPDGELVTIILRGAMIGTGETSEQQVDDILEKAIKRGGAKLKRLREIFEELFPGEPHDIPDPGEMNIAKFKDGMISSDNCNSALKVKRLLVAAVQEAIKHNYTAEEWEAFNAEEKEAKLRVLEGDCYNHLRNVWFGRMSNGITEKLKDKLKDELETIDFRLRVGTGMDGVLRALDKEFSLCANYPKGHGDMFKEWMARCHPRALLYHVVSTSGGRQDMVCEGSGALYMNRTYWVEFIDERLRVPGAANILQECLFIELTCIDMIASARVHSILHLSVVMPHRWLAGNSHTLAKYDWSERSMGITVDLLELAMVRVVEGDDEHAPGQLFFNQAFMFSIFD